LEVSGRGGEGGSGVDVKGGKKINDSQKMRNNALEK
jgi:hypothetical protein